MLSSLHRTFARIAPRGRRVAVAATAMALIQSRVFSGVVASAVTTSCRCCCVLAAPVPTLAAAAPVRRFSSFTTCAVAASHAPLPSSPSAAASLSSSSSPLPLPEIDPSELPFAWPSSPLPSSSTLQAYLAQDGFLTEMLEEIESQPHHDRGWQCTILGLHGNLVLVRLDQLPVVDSNGGDHTQAAPGLETNPPEEGQDASSSPSSSSAPLDALLPPLHAAVTWFSPLHLVPFRSVTHAAQSIRRALRENGAPPGTKVSCYSGLEGAHRKSAIILEQLPQTRIAPHEQRIRFPLQLPPSLTAHPEVRVPGAALPEIGDSAAVRKKKKKRAAKAAAAAAVSDAVASQEPPALDNISEEPHQLEADSSDSIATPSHAASSPPAAAPSSSSPPLPPLASFTLLTPSLLLLSTRTSSPLSNGSLRFLWDRSGPPSRAYLKLWEALTRMHVEMVLAHHGVSRGQEIWERLKPQPGSIVLDLGAAPGGWTWAAAQLGATVVSVDRAELAQPVARMHNVHHHIGSGFSVGPDAALLRPFFAQRRAAAAPRVGSAASDSADSQDLDRSLDRIDWLLCDIVCYPARALTLVRRWLDTDAVQAGIVVTIKLQREGEVMPASAGEDNAASALEGSTTPAAAAASVKGPAQQYHLRQQAAVLSQLRSIPNARLMHLQENKNEVTFMWLRPQSE